MRFDNKIIINIFLIVVFCSPVSVVFATSQITNIPRFVTIKVDKANARTGPASDCPIEWIFVTKGEPVEVIAEYGKWRKVRDVHDEGGWVHCTLLSHRRSIVIITNNTVPLLHSPKQYDKIIVKLMPHVRCILYKCESGWCKINCHSYKGWVSKKFLWGVYPDE